jgi:hypothetical protein
MIHTQPQNAWEELRAGLFGDAAHRWRRRIREQRAS